MPLNPDKNLKIYYSIKEVAEQVGVNESTLRSGKRNFRASGQRQLHRASGNIQKKTLNRLK